MQFLEFAFQGVRGFSPAMRAALRPGYCLLKAPGAIQPPLTGLCTSLLYPDGRGGDSEYKAPGQPQGRASMTMVAADQSVFRLVRSLGGAGALQQLNKVSNQFELLSEDPAEMAQFLRSQLGLPTRKVFESVLAFGIQQLPTRRQRGVQPAPSATGLLPPRPALSPLPSQDAGTDLKLKQLEQELALSKEVEQLQYRADGLASKLFEAERKLKASESLKDSIKVAEAAYSKAPTPASLQLPADILERAERFPAIIEKYQQALAKLGSEREDGYDGVPRLLQPVHQRPSFWAAVGGGIASIVLGMAVGGKGRYLALLDIPSFGLAAILAINYIDDLRHSKQANRKGERLVTREKKIQEEYEAEAQVIKAALATLQVETPADIIEELAEKGKLKAQVESLRQQLAGYERSPEYLAARSGVAALKREQQQLEAQLAEKGAYVRDAREVEREIDRLRQSVAMAKASAEIPAPVVSEGASQDPFPALFSVGAELFGLDAPAAAASVKDRWFQYFAALTDQRYQNLHLEKEGKVHLTCGGQPVPAVAVPGMDLDLLYLSARFALVEKFCVRNRVPCLLDDVLVGLDESKLYLLGRMLKQLGQLTQVLHAASQPGLEQVADTSVNV